MAAFSKVAFEDEQDGSRFEMPTFLRPRPRPGCAYVYAAIARPRECRSGIGDRGWSYHRRVKIEPVDERDSRWESHDARFRVYVFEESGWRAEADGSLSQGYSTATWDVTGADLLDVIQWAEERAGDRGVYSVALVADVYEAHRDQGLVWLVGRDYQDTPMDDRSRDVQKQMLGRRGRKAINPE